MYKNLLILLVLCMGGCSMMDCGEPDECQKKLQVCTAAVDIQLKELEECSN